MIEKWITENANQFPMVILSAVVTYFAIIVYTRWVGLRSLSKMTAADFAMTVAVGSLFGATISSPTPTLFLGLVAIASLYAGQWSIAYLRRHSRRFGKWVDNEPLLLMRGSQIYDQNLQRANVTRGDLYGKLREANALDYDQVLAVVFETTGDVSVLRADESHRRIHPDFMNGVIDYVAEDSEPA
ncbi:DUF421 domain-containing protein [Roseiconus nitratireducens]|uniref:DUF421 domain-containing protein n=1 Tax=Roseiconus nitratireducens TaxID=2605748 RepID=A0A5M6D9I5_9BACT|nr:YetF domain-containing protein [Roseiconus nitratireducens]KAA5542599.1 DUF421 domain-containing protein [Roseiconus nitratireducens]